MRYGYMLLLALALTTIVEAGTPWSQFHGSSAHAGRWDGQITPAAVQGLWSSPAGIYFNRSSQPTVAGNGQMVFAYTEVSTYAGMIYGLTAADGSAVWSATVKSRVDIWSSSSPVYNDGFVYWAGSDNTGKFSVYKIDAENGGTAVWSNESYVGEIVNNSVMVADGKLFISTYGATAANYYAYSAQHYAIDITDGQIVWTNEDNGQGQGSMAYDAGRDVVYQTVRVGTDHKVRAYHADTGLAAWTSPWSAAFAFHQSGIAYDSATDALYVQDYNSYGDGYVYKVSAADGSKVWEAPTPISGTSAPAIDGDGQVYVFSDYGFFVNPGQTRAYEADGTILWTTNQAGGWNGSAGWADGYVFAGDQVDDDFYLLDDQTGTAVLTLTGSGPVAFGTDAFYTIGLDGRLYAYAAGSQALIPGDTDGDGDVDIVDLGSLAGNYGRSSDATWAMGDFDGDGDVDIVDLGALAGNYGTGLGGALNFEQDYQTAFSAVPEPTTMLFLLLGLGWWSAARRGHVT